MTTEPSFARRGLDRLLAAYPDRDVEAIDGQPERADRTRSDGAIELGQSAGPWICIRLGGNEYAIWKATGDVYCVGPDGAVEEDPILTINAR